MLPVVDHLNRYVSCVESFVLFYADALGYQLLNIGVKENGKPYAILKGEGHELFISEKEVFEELDNNFRHIGYAVENADDALKKLKSKGIAGPETEIIIKSYSRQFYLRDPDGFEIDFIQWTDKRGFYENLELRKAAQKNM